MLMIGTEKMIHVEHNYFANYEKSKGDILKFRKIPNKENYSDMTVSVDLDYSSLKMKKKKKHKMKKVYKIANINCLRKKNKRKLLNATNRFHQMHISFSGEPNHINESLYSQRDGINCTNDSKTIIPQLEEGEWQENSMIMEIKNSNMRVENEELCKDEELCKEEEKYNSDTDDFHCVTKSFLHDSLNNCSCEMCSLFIQNGDYSDIIHPNDLPLSSMLPKEINDDMEKTRKEVDTLLELVDTF
ncbi:uncharacterized protein LOC123681222 [Harmonia axyridis]|uniref:uncharacterized protein LOC123681222 n=1 Tax=Harmonia axyridis TaxID=115357 RepID=UPI001E279147|nr:uncharacterized protein LOC123681222 [Harmonia axyridis]